MGGHFWLAFLGVAIIGLVRLFAGCPAARALASASALAILEERYARGEINREEYEQRRRDLNH